MKILALLTLLLISLALKAQDYTQSVGLRFGYTSAITYEFFKDDIKAFQAMLGYRNGGAQLYTVIESYHPIRFERSDNFFYYTGLGAHIGYTTFTENEVYNYPWGGIAYSQNRKFRPVIGLDALFGLECRFYHVPLSLYVDVKPFFDIFGQYYFELIPWDFAFGIKYTFR